MQGCTRSKSPPAKPSPANLAHHSPHQQASGLCNDLDVPQPAYWAVSSAAGTLERESGPGLGWWGAWPPSLLGRGARFASTLAAWQPGSQPVQPASQPARQSAIMKPELFASQPASQPEPAVEARWERPRTTQPVTALHAGTLVYHSCTRTTRRCSGTSTTCL